MKKSDSYSIPYSVLEDAVIQHLLEEGYPEAGNIEVVDLGLSLNDDGKVDVDVEYFDDWDNNYINPGDDDSTPPTGAEISWLQYSRGV